MAYPCTTTLLAVAALFLCATTTLPLAAASENGGGVCAGCTILMALTEDTMYVRKQNAREAIHTLCSFLPWLLSDVCETLSKYMADVEPMLDKGINPDAICNALGICTHDTAVCRLFPNRLGTSSESSDNKRHSDAEMVQYAATVQRRMNIQPITHPVHVQAFNICTILPAICTVEKHLPFSDNDGDLFSTIPGLRGTNWRGKDCNDKDPNIYPGRDSNRNSSNDPSVDDNCNGISGVSPDSGESWESQLCGGTGAFGVAAVGDSATAHFRIPPIFLEAETMNKSAFSGLYSLAEDEADWPMLSWGTGYDDANKYKPEIEGPMMSVYSLGREHNRCNHRDYQNLGVNGARVKDLDDFVKLLARHPDTDKPMIVFFSMVGNDVCNHHHGFDTMTTPKEYYNALHKALLSADARLPKGSHVIIFPLVDGRVLYDTMHNKIHPIGRIHKDVTYKDFYNYLNCLDISPCWGWMNDNATIRDKTWSIASAMNDRIEPLIKDTAGQLHNIKVHYLGNVVDMALRDYHGPREELIEPVDGFHPSQLANSIIGNLTFSLLREAKLVGEANPNNHKIEKLFGDQGGY